MKIDNLIPMFWFRFLIPMFDSNFWFQCLIPIFDSNVLIPVTNISTKVTAPWKAKPPPYMIETEWCIVSMCIAACALGWFDQKTCPHQNRKVSPSELCNIHCRTSDPPALAQEQEIIENQKIWTKAGGTILGDLTSPQEMSNLLGWWDHRTTYQWIYSETQ